MAIILAGVSVGVADALIKKLAVTGNFWSLAKSPSILAITLLYALQIALFVYAFKHQWKLGIAGNMQMVFYSLTVVVVGLIFLGEQLSWLQGLGIGLALAGVVLMSL
ncbi:hypothetical protein EPO05_03835 [Patescibacteria group bacterium]|nr:MAG: hypothetical protein EPO05_03835 [Patescibacteria group bacterium]